VNSTTKWNFKQLAKDVLVSKASRPASKVVMTYQHLSQIEQYKLYILMKNGKTEIITKSWRAILTFGVAAPGKPAC
jgi:hypothetical protein